jgi:ribonucleotide monophosphatase NagD (HAD superfamily)
MIAFGLFVGSCFVCTVLRSSSKGKKKERFGMVFDLDGVIYRSGPSGKRPVGDSVKAIRALSERSVPFCFVTNSTGITEDEKAKTLSKILGLNILSSRVFMATSPMRDLAKRFGEKRVLFVAGMFISSLNVFTLNSHVRHTHTHKQTVLKNQKSWRLHLDFKILSRFKSTLIFDLHSCRTGKRRENQLTQKQ